MEIFDKVSKSYVNINDQFTSFFGDKTDYFVQYKAAYVKKVLGENFNGRILDFGCGIGLVTHKLRSYLLAATIDGVDSSHESIQLAKEATKIQSGQFQTTDDWENDKHEYDVILLFNVLHHIIPSERPNLIKSLNHRLTRKGKIIVIEHNTYNMIVMRILAKHPFDVEAVFLPLSETRSLLKSSHFRVDHDFIVFFPSFLRWLRPFESWLRWLPIGAQYACIGKAIERNS